MLDPHLSAHVNEGSKPSVFVVGTRVEVVGGAVASEVGSADPSEADADPGPEPAEPDTPEPVAAEPEDPEDSNEQTSFKSLQQSPFIPQSSSQKHAKTSVPG